MIGKKTIWLLVALSSLLGCGKDPEQPDPAPNEPDPDPPPTSTTAPVINSFAPLKGIPGSEVIIQGKNFRENKLQNTVLFQGDYSGAFVVAASTTQLTVRVPETATTGKITVKVGNQSVTSAGDFTIEPAVTAIAGFTPRQGPFGTVVTLTGTKFDDAITVKLNGIEAKLQQRSSTRIVFTIPTNTSLTSHKISVTSGNTQLETAEPFTVTAAGPYARWENKQVVLMANGSAVFGGGLSFVHQNKIYWGFTGLQDHSTKAQYVVFDPANTGQGWQYKDAPAGITVQGPLFATSVVHNNRVFLGTGMASGGSNNQWWEFHPATNTRTALTDFPHNTGGALSFVLNNDIYVGWGSENGNLYRFDPAANNNKGSFTLAATAPFSDLTFGNTFIIGNDVYMGRALQDVTDPFRKAVYKFTTPGLLARMTDIPEEEVAYNTAAFTLGNKGYLVINKNVWEYTPGNNGGSWRAVIAPTTGPSIQHVAVLTINGNRVIYGWNASGRIFEFRF